MKSTTVKTFDAILGQQRAIRWLTRTLEKDRVAHALLFTGIDGIGKQTTAKALGMAMNCQRPVRGLACKTCPACKKMLSGNHPDLILIGPDGAFIKIDQVRDLQKRLMFAPINGGTRLVVVNDAQTMNAEASNAMLKILEEPPDNTYIVLTAAQTSDLLPTIVSRCQHLCFEPLSCETIANELTSRRGLDETDAMAIALLAKGSLGKALCADTQEWVGWRNGLIERMESMANASVHKLFAFAQAIAHDKDRVQDVLDMMMIWFRDLLMSKLCPEKVLNRDRMRDIERASEGCSVDDLLGKIAIVSDTQRAISNNANLQLALEVMMMRLASRKGPSPCDSGTDRLTAKQ